MAFSEATAAKEQEVLQSYRDAIRRGDGGWIVATFLGGIIIGIVALWFGGAGSVVTNSGRIAQAVSDMQNVQTLHDQDLKTLSRDIRVTTDSVDIVKQEVDDMARTKR